MTRYFSHILIWRSLQDDDIGICNGVDVEFQAKGVSLTLSRDTAAGETFSLFVVLAYRQVHAQLAEDPIVRGFKNILLPDEPPRPTMIPEESMEVIEGESDFE